VRWGGRRGGGVGGGGGGRKSLKVLKIEEKVILTMFWPYFY